jgi:hypothetical protein
VSPAELETLLEQPAQAREDLGPVVCDLDHQFRVGRIPSAQKVEPLISQIRGAQEHIASATALVGLEPGSPA